MTYYYIRGQVENMGDRTMVFYTTTDIIRAKKYEEKLKNMDNIVMTIITKRIYK